MQRGAQVKPADRAREIEHQKPWRSVYLLDLRAQIVEHPAVHQNVNPAAMQESRGDQTPVLVSLKDLQPPACTKLEDRRREICGPEEQAEVDHKNQDCGEVRLRNQSAHN